MLKIVTANGKVLEIDDAEKWTINDNGTITVEDYWGDEKGVVSCTNIVAILKE